MQIPVKYTSYAIMKQYKNVSLFHQGYIIFEIRKGMYGLPQYGIISKKCLVKELSTSGYHQSNYSSSLFTHKW